MNIILKASKQISVDFKSDESKKQMNDEIIRTFKKNGVIGIFPEGMRTPKDELSKAYPGVGRFALQNKVAVLPVGIKGSYELWPRHKKLPRLKRNIKVIIGKPMNVHEMPEVLNSENPEEEATRRVMIEIGRLIDQEYKF